MRFVSIRVSAFCPPYDSARAEHGLAGLGRPIDFESLNRAVEVLDRLDQRTVSIGIVVGEALVIVFSEAMLVERLGSGIVGGRPGRIDNRRALAEEVHRFEALFDALDLFFKLAAEDHDGDVGAAE